MAIISSSVLQDFEVITPKKKDAVIDKNKMRRERSNLRLKEKACVSNERNNKILVNEKGGKTFHKKMIKEEHMTLLSEPGNNFLGHIAVDRGTSQIKTNAIENFLSESNICTKQIKAVGCDQLL